MNRVPLIIRKWLGRFLQTEVYVQVSGGPRVSVETEILPLC